MRKREAAEKGHIICTASDAGLYPFPVAPIYAVSKHGMVGAVRSLAKKLELEGIRINGIAPNVVGKFFSSSALPLLFFVSRVFSLGGLKMNS